MGVGKDPQRSMMAWHSWTVGARGCIYRGGSSTIASAGIFRLRGELPSKPPPLPPPPLSPREASRQDMVLSKDQGSASVDQHAAVVAPAETIFHLHRKK